ncbi:response regulator transcription factor, partial [Eubacterium callanderi]
MQTEILVVDDEQEIADLVELYLGNEGYAVRKFYSAQEALASGLENPPELAVLDVMMPELDGFTLCRRLREKYTFPIIMLTAREEEIDKITGLAIGADDYVTKPFRPLELVARVKAQLRRSQRYNGGQQEAGAIAAYRGLTLNRETHVCT